MSPCRPYRETANNYRDWTGDYGFGFNRGE